MRQKIYNILKENLQGKTDRPNFWAADITSKILRLVNDKHPDIQRLDFLQEITDEERFTGEVLLRDSMTGRGWRLHESQDVNACRDVRKAIDRYREPYHETRPEETYLKEKWLQPHDLNSDHFIKIGSQLVGVDEVKPSNLGFKVVLSNFAVRELNVARGTYINVFEFQRSEDENESN